MKKMKISKENKTHSKTRLPARVRHFPQTSNSDPIFKKRVRNSVHIVYTELFVEPLYAVLTNPTIKTSVWCINVHACTCMHAHVLLQGVVVVAGFLAHCAHEV